MNKIERIRRHASYDDDFARWSAEQSELIRQRRFEEVDLENVAEEIESLGRSDKREIESGLKVLLVHLLKLKFQPEQGKPGWRSTIIEQRRRIAKLIEESPSLKAYPMSVLGEEYEYARSDAAAETGIAVAAFPETCPFSIQEVLELSFFPTATSRNV